MKIRTKSIVLLYKLNLDFILAYLYQAEYVLMSDNFRRERRRKIKGFKRGWEMD